MNDDMCSFLNALFVEAVRVVGAQNCLPAYLPPVPQDGHLIILGAGKAAADMAAVAGRHYRDMLGAQFEKQVSGLVITRYGHGVRASHIEVVEAGHPKPDAAGLNATRRLFAMAKGARKNDLVLLLLSGGGSALLTMPRCGISLDLKREVSSELMGNGACIAELNCVRKHLSGIKGGKLALAAAPARMLTLAISDVAGDNPGVIASGPGVLDETSPAQAFEILEKFDIARRDELRFILEDTRRSGPGEFAHADFQLIARPMQALEAAAKLAKKRGWQTRILGDALEGDATLLAKAHAAKILAAPPGENGIILLSGGEVTVRLTGDGEGGPNQEYALALALALDGARGVYALACDTDGNDGGRGRADDPAGAVISPSTLARARAKGLDAGRFLANNDSGSFFAVLDDLVQTGPTLTNVNDFRVLLRQP